MHGRPPCWPDGQPCPNACAFERAYRDAYNHHTLSGPWSGWRLAGGRLINPHGEWIGPHTLDRIMHARSVVWREEQRVSRRMAEDR